MNKRLFYVFAALLVSLNTFAQWGDNAADISAQPKKNAFFVGPKVGVVMTSMSQPEQCKLADGSGVGFSAGIAAKLRLGQATPNSEAGTGMLAIGLELKYQQNKVKTFGTDEGGKANADLGVDYFEVPVFVQLYPFCKSEAMNSFYVEVGAALATAMSRSPKSLTVNNPGNGLSSIVYNLDNKGSKLAANDVRPLIGLGYTVPGTGLDINARYYIGMSKMAGNFNSKMSCAEVSFAWMFNAGSF